MNRLVMFRVQSGHVFSRPERKTWNKTNETKRHHFNSSKIYTKKHHPKFFVIPTGPCISRWNVQYLLCTDSKIQIIQFPLPFLSSFLLRVELSRVEHHVTRCRGWGMWNTNTARWGQSGGRTGGVKGGGSHVLLCSKSSPKWTFTKELAC